MGIPELDKEISALQDSLDPAGKTYRYDLVRLDVLTLQRDMLVMEDGARAAEMAAQDLTQQVHNQEIRLSIMETAMALLCGRAAHDILTTEMLKKIAKATK